MDALITDPKHELSSGDDSPSMGLNTESDASSEHALVHYAAPGRNYRRKFEVRPHSALGYATPKEFARQSSASFAVQILSLTRRRNRVKAIPVGSLRSALTRPQIQASSDI